jgi:hypothetical protein
MSAQTLKQEALEAIQSLPENADIEDIMYRLHVINKLRKSHEAIAHGQVLSHEELKREVEKW